MQKITSVLKPYGLRTDALDNPGKYGLPPINVVNKEEQKIKIYGLISRRQSEVYIPLNYPLPKITGSFKKYKVFVPYAWGNMDEKAGLGGDFSDVSIGKPMEICTESFQEQRSYDSLDKAIAHAKFIMTRFARALLYVNKYSQHSTTDWGAVPIQDFTEKWWSESIDEIEENLFNKYNVPENIRTFIRKNVQRKTEENIINKV